MRSYDITVPDSLMKWNGHNFLLLAQYETVSNHQWICWKIKYVTLIFDLNKIDFLELPEITSLCIENCDNNWKLSSSLSTDNGACYRGYCITITTSPFLTSSDYHCTTGHYVTSFDINCLDYVKYIITVAPIIVCEHLTGEIQSVWCQLKENMLFNLL